ncbi:acyl-CoA thioesterase [Pikeienuella piscinae]|uniref:acyl-CoA thioesterase n=1 Tax=Pikeienuella piscinae TaxID=2748098 RepID=UPI001FE768EB|nr:thioesterase family protein [Pikeienuella piscinae]
MENYPEAKRSAFPEIQTIPTRWNDNDIYGHMNNVVYAEYFDTAVNRWLIGSGALDVPGGPIVGLVAETRCKFLSSVGFPDILETGLSALHVGNSSVIYGLGLFHAGAETPAALCRYVHVYVDAAGRRPTPIPESLRRALTALDPGFAPRTPARG